MAVNVVRYRQAGKIGWGVVVAGGVVPIPGEYETTGDFVRDGVGRARELAAAAPAVALADVELLSPVTSNQQFVCQAVNYFDHMAESGIDPADQPFNIFFRKASSCLAPPHADVVRPAHVQLLDYEVELGLVIAREIRGPLDVTPATLHEVVAGLVVTNDVSARDIQLPQTQFYKGKSYRTFGPTGPYLTLVDAADLARFEQLRLRLWVNDELRQNGLTAGMVYKPAATLTELSALQDLDPGDLVATGTPGGCALRAPHWMVMFISSLLPPRVRWANFLKMASQNPRFLKPGDRMRASIATDDGALDLGTQENRIVAA